MSTKDLIREGHRQDRAEHRTDIRLIAEIISQIIFPDYKRNHETIFSPVDSNSSPTRLRCKARIINFVHTAASSDHDTKEKQTGFSHALTLKPRF